VSVGFSVLGSGLVLVFLSECSFWFPRSVQSLVKLDLGVQDGVRPKVALNGEPWTDDKADTAII